MKELKEKIKQVKTVQPGIYGKDETWYVFTPIAMYKVLALAMKEMRSQCVAYTGQYFTNDVTDIIMDVPLPDLTEILKEDGLRI